MNLHSSTKRKPSVLSKRIGAVGFTAIAAAMMLSAGSAHAAAKPTAEQKALDAYLTTTYGKTTANADATQLADAVNKVVTDNPKLKLANVAGEALKSAGALQNDAGTKIGEVVFTRVGTNAATLQKTVADAAKFAGSKTGANVEEVAAFANAALTADSDFTNAAKLAKSSKSAVGAIIAGLAIQKGDAAADEAAANAAKAAVALAAIGDKSLAAAVTEISRYVGTTVTDAVSFAKTVTEGASDTLAIKIIPGVVTASPEDAGAITTQLFNTTDATLKTKLQKSAALLASSVSKVADIEQISVVGSTLSEQIGSGAVKISSAAGIAKTLAKAILAKPSDGRYRTTNANKIDEIGEVAAYIVGGIVNNAGFTEKAAPKIVLAIIKSAVAGGKATGAQKKQGIVLDTATYVKDIVGSVALTIANSTIADTVKTKIQELLLKSAKTIAGGSQAATVTAAINEGFTNTAEVNLKYENGVHTAEQLQKLVDPETADKNS